MKIVLRWLAVATCVVALTTIGFNVYGNLLLDYSLDSLESALSITNTHADESTPLEQNVYKNFVQGLALDELVKKKPNLQEIVVLDLASRSLGEAADRLGNKRAEVYLKQVQQNRFVERGAIFRLFDRAYYVAREFYRSFIKLLDYFGNRFIDQPEDEEGEDAEYTSVFILAQATQKEREGVLDEAAELYLKFLEFYPNSDRYGFVALSLGNIYLRQNKLEEAKAILRPVKSQYLGTEEGGMAASVIDRINLIENRLDYIERLKQLRLNKTDASEVETLTLKLAVAQFSVYQFDDAAENFKTLLHASAQNIQQKASFYLGWLYKLQGSLDESESVLLGLVDSPELTEDLKISLHAQLADVYHMMKDPEKAIEHLEVVTGGTNKALRTLKASEHILRAISEIETASIYFYDYQDADNARSALDRFRETNLFGFDNAGIRDPDLLSPYSLRDSAFRALSQGRVDVAHDLLNKNLDYFPRDPWTHSALASLYLLFGELEKAQDYALKGYRWHEDEYTTSVLAYVYSYMENFEEAINLYETALAKDPEYLPAQFNLACMYLEISGYRQALTMLMQINDKLSYRENYMKSKVLNNIGYAFWGLGILDEAEVYFKRALDKTPGFEIASKNLALIQKQDAPEMVTFKG